MENVYDNVKAIVSIVPAVLTANTNGTGVDTQGYANGKLTVAVGDLDLASGNETYVVSIEESDASGSGYAAVSGLTVAMTADNTIGEIRLSNLNTTRKRYLRAVLTVGGTTPSCPISAVFQLGQPVSGPVN